MVNEAFPGPRQQRRLNDELDRLGSSQLNLSRAGSSSPADVATDADELAALRYFEADAGSFNKSSYCLNSSVNLIGQ